jgi:hypothetical protein
MLFRAFLTILESVFFVGLAGSLVVAIMAFVGDIHVFFDEDEKEKSTTQAQPRHAESH